MRCPRVRQLPPPPKPGDRKHKKTLTGKSHRALLSSGDFRQIYPELSAFPHRVTRETHGSVRGRATGPLSTHRSMHRKTALKQLPNAPPTDHQRAGPEPGAGRLVTPGTLLGFRHARASPSMYQFQRPPGTSPTYTELTPARPGGPHAAIRRERPPWSIRPRPVPCHRSRPVRHP